MNRPDTTKGGIGLYGIDLLDLEAFGGIRLASIVKGLWADPDIRHDHEHEWIEAAKQPVTYDHGVSTRQSRDPKIRRVMADSFKLYMKQVTELETRILRIFGVDIDTVRRIALTGEIPESPKFKYTPKQDKLYIREINTFAEDILGTDVAGDLTKKKEVSEIEALFPERSLLAFSVGLQNTWDEILRELPDYVDPKTLEKLMAKATLKNPYLKAMIDAGGKRIRTELALKWMEYVRLELRTMGAGLETVYEAAKFLHELVGEGKAWYWQRIARSEAALAFNAAYNAQGEAVGVQYTMWDAGPDCCEICAYFSGKVWKFGDNPEPVSDSHPHCLCGLHSYFELPEDKGQQNKWDRESPYDRPWTAEEFEQRRIELKR